MGLLRRLSGQLTGRVSGRLTDPLAGSRAETYEPVIAHYRPEPDGEPDPGEVVWGWVPYEDDPSRGKDRPVLLLREHDGGWMGLMLSSKDHDRDAADEARHGRHWMDIGTGGWDPRARPSEVRLDREILLRRDAVRREGAALPPELFDEVVAAVRALPG